MLMEILTPALILGALGLLLGAGLALASKKFAVEANPVQEQVRACLPGANCGGCGFPGCDGYAAAVANGEAAPNKCPVGGAPVAAEIAKVLGVEVDESEPKVAYVACQGTTERAKKKYEYHGILDCRSAALVSGGDKACVYGCLGYGSCVEACMFDAIHISEGGVAVVDPFKCTGCGKCVETCPKSIISLIPASQRTRVTCRALEKGKAVRENCTVGCIGCGLCVKKCVFGAIEIENNLPKIDFDKCRNCMACAESCPTHALTALLETRKMAFIHEESCVGCTICKKNCPFNAIEGELKEKHVVIPSACKGCGVCAEKCPKKAITMEERN